MANISAFIPLEQLKDIIKVRNGGDLTPEDYITLTQIVEEDVSIAGLAREYQGTIDNPNNIEILDVIKKKIVEYALERIGYTGPIVRSTLGATLILTLETFSVSIQGHDFTR